MFITYSECKKKNVYFTLRKMIKTVKDIGDRLTYAKSLLVVHWFPKQASLKQCKKRYNILYPRILLVRNKQNLRLVLSMTKSSQVLSTEV